MNKPLSGSPVLVADRDAQVRAQIITILGRNGYTTLESAHGAEALDLYHRHNPEIIVLAAELPGRNGFEVCGAIRRSESERGKSRIENQVPIVLLTESDDTDSAARAYDSGASDFVSRPINLLHLEQRIRHLLRMHLAMKNLLIAEARNRAMLSAMPDAMFRLNRRGKVLDHQPGKSDTAQPENCVGRHLREIFPGDVAERLMYGMGRALATGEMHAAEYALTFAEGRYHYESRLVPVEGDEVLVLVRDVSERIQAEQKIRNLAYFDSLTGMPNRRAFLDIVERELRRHKQDDASLALLFLDLDGFKRVNDTLGHMVGDRLLQAVAVRLREVIRAVDQISRIPRETNCARLGGDEFTILLTRLDQPEDAIMVAERINHAFKRPFILDTHEVVVTSSIGISLYPQDGMDAIALLKYADTAMYHAKDQGRNNHQLYSASLTTRMTRRLELENSLRKALQRGEFELHYQPQIEFSGTRIVGMEALIRWNHPDLGQLAPGEFITVAEESGLIIPIGEWALRSACHQAKAWQAAGLDGIRTAVNLSGAQFRDENLVPMILAIMHETGLSGNLLEFELTESILMHNVDLVIERLDALRAKGIRLSIDDFGTGYSSMSSLQRLPVHMLKIDQSFVQDLVTGSSSTAITQAIIAMARSLDMSVIAEGVETVEQAQELSRHGCDLMQGFYFGRPLAAAHATLTLMNSARGAAILQH